MAWTSICCQYDGTFAGFLTCVFECYLHREEPVEFRRSEDLCCSLYPLRNISTNKESAQRVYRSLAIRMGPLGQRTVVRGFLTCLPDRELWLWRLIRAGYRRGPDLFRDLTNPVMDKVGKAVHHLEHEAHLFTGFVRFSDLDGVLVGEIEPKNRVLPLLRPHFCGRYPQEHFILHDRIHQEALFHRPGKWAILPVSYFQIGPPDGVEQAFRTMWRSFYEVIAIQGRYNPRCRMTHMPKRYWNTMTEFQGQVPPAALARTPEEACGGPGIPSTERKPNL